MLDWNEIDTVLLDMDGTLLDLSFDNYFWLEHLPREYSRLAKMPLGEARDKLSAMSESLMGTLNWYCIDYWSEVLEVDIESMKHDVRDRIRRRPYTLEFLNFLNGIDKEVIMVTNAHPKSLELKVAVSGLHDFMDKMISSHEFALAKENEGFWHKFSSREGIDLSRCLFIDDNHAVLTRARQEGVKYNIQVLHPDMGMEPRPATDFPGIHDFDELIDQAVTGAFAQDEQKTNLS